MQPHYLKDNFASFVSVQLHCERDLKRLGMSAASAREAHGARPAANPKRPDTNGLPRSAARSRLLAPRPGALPPKEKKNLDVHPEFVGMATGR